MHRIEGSLLLGILDQLKEMSIVVRSVARVRQFVVTQHMEPEQPGVEEGEPVLGAGCCLDEGGDKMSLSLALHMQQSQTAFLYPPVEQHFRWFLKKILITVGFKLASDSSHISHSQVNTSGSEPYLACTVCVDAERPRY